MIYMEGILLKLSQSSRMRFVFSLYLLNLMAWSCGNSTSVDEEVKDSKELIEPIFKEKSFAQTGINFINTVLEDTVHNFFNYNYIYNGAGLAVGDFNNDELQDVIFVSNQSENRLFLNQGGLKFENITSDAGVISYGGWKNGVTVVDINQDGLDDIYLSRSGRYEDPSERANELYINNGDLTFTESAKDYGLADTGYGIQAYFFDHDRDGDLDMYMMNHRLDFENKNTLEVFYKNPYIDQSARDRLYENRNGKYVDITDLAGIVNHAWGLSVVTGDFNEDSYPDIYVANDYLSPDFLYINNQDGTYTESIEKYFPHMSFYSMGSDWADIDNNGHFDLYTLDMAPEDHVRSKKLMASMSNEVFRTMVDEGLQYQYMINTLQYNHGEGAYSEISQLSGINKTDWSWTALFQDFDNDGLKDLYVTNGIRKDITDNDAMIETDQLMSSGQRITLGQVLDILPSDKLQNPIFRNKGDLHFERINEDWGMNKAYNSNGAVAVDFDNDGDLEVLTNNMDLAASFYENLTVQNGGSALRKVSIRGPKGNLKGLGAEIEFHTSNGVVVDQVRNSRGYLSNSEIAIYITEELAIEKALVKWPTGEISEVTGEDLQGELEFNYAELDKRERQKKSQPKLFTEAEVPGLNDQHVENNFDDFIREILLPHRQSEHGPFVEKADFNADGLEDVLIGGASGQPTKLLVQSSQGTFKANNQGAFATDADHEDVGAEIFDFDNDGDLDIYVVSGSGEFYQNNEELLRDRLYLNDGSGNFEKAPNGTLPDQLNAGSKALASDIDQDGDQDLIVLNRNVAGNYPLGPKSSIYVNEGGKFVDQTRNFSSDLYELDQMSVDGTLVDLDGNGYEDLIVVGEWTEPQIFMNDGDELAMANNDFSDLKGWWRSVEAEDLDGDGDLDLVVGNIGTNNKYHPKKDSPLFLFYNDFDENGVGDIVLSKSNGEELLPVRGRECSSQQMPFILDKFESYDKYANADLVSIYSQEGLDEALQLEVNNFKSGILWNNDGEFDFEALPTKAQFGAINDIIIKDFNNDGKSDLLVTGNFYGSEVETVRYDSHYGTVLMNMGNQKFSVLPYTESGLKLDSDVRNAQLINVQGQETLVVVSNDDTLRSYKVEK